MGETQLYKDLDTQVAKFEEDTDCQAWNRKSHTPRVLTRVVSKMVLNYLVGGLEHVLFSIICRIVLPIDFHIFQDG